jgi:hypothetical protein
VRRGREGPRAAPGPCARGKPPECLDADEILRTQREGLTGKARDVRVHGRECGQIPLSQGRGERVVIDVTRHQPVDGEVLVPNSDSGELPRRPGHLGQRRAMRPGNKDEPRGLGIGELLDSGRITRTLLFQARQRTEARCIALAGFQEP